MFTPTFGGQAGPNLSIFDNGGSWQNGGNGPAAQNGGQFGNSTNLADVYQNALGRAPDAAGLSYYQNKLDDGSRTFDQLRQNIWQSPEAQGYQSQQAQQPSQPNVFDTAGGAYNQAVSMAGSGGGNIKADQVQANLLRDTNLDPYMNPYTQAVTDQALGDLGRSHDIAMNSTNSAASGAFGGSRHGVMQAETNRNFADATARTSAGLNSQNFSNAQASAFQDIGNQLSAAQGNQQANLSAGISNASNNLQGASTLGNLSNLGFTLGNNALGAQADAGAQQQNLMQQIIDAGKSQTLGQTGEADTALSRLLAALGGIPAPTSTETSESPGVLGFLTGLL